MNRFFIYTVLVALAIASCVSAFAQIEIPSSPEAQRAVELSNIERAKQGLPPLKAQANLMRARCPARAGHGGEPILPPHGTQRIRAVGPCACRGVHRLPRREHLHVLRQRES